MAERCSVTDNYVAACPHCLKLQRDEARAQRDWLRALLREVEWVEAWDDEGAEWWFCAVCRCDKSDGHARDCRLAAALEGRDG